MNGINRLFAERGDRKLLSIYFCAGCPVADNTGDVLKALQRNGIDMVEVGIPFSDPLADGPVIQSAATTALKNGTTLHKIFEQLDEVKSEINIPVILMGYLNVILSYGIENFCRSCRDCGVSGAIIPDLPFDDYINTVKPLADEYGLRIIMMITPETSDERIRFIDENTDGFIYMVSCAGTTGAKNSFDEAGKAYFKRVGGMGLKNPCMTGFGISNKQTLDSARKYSAGAIIGSKFVSLLNEYTDPDKATKALYAALEA